MGYSGSDYFADYYSDILGVSWDIIQRMLILYLFTWGIAALVGLATYVLQSLSLYTISKRRRIKKPWLSWIPFGYLWILGSIADQYRYVVKGQVKNKRKALLTLEILVAAAMTACFVLWGVLMSKLILATMGVPDYNELINIATAMAVLAIAAGGMKVASAVIQYMADYDLYRSCEPGNAVLYLVLSIFFSITRPIFMILCSKKDGGMPPRKQEPMAAIPAQEPCRQETAE